jgi:hypothetical protein
MTRDYPLIGLAVVLAARAGDEAGVRMLCEDLDPADDPSFRRFLDLYATDGGPFAAVSDERLRSALADWTLAVAAR